MIKLETPYEWPRTKQQLGREAHRCNMYLGTALFELEGMVDDWARYYELAIKRNRPKQRYRMMRMSNDYQKAVNDKLKDLSAKLMWSLLGGSSDNA